MRCLLPLVVLAACGDDLHPTGPPLLRAPHLTIVAHQDDDLLFMQPDLADLAERHAGLTNIYVTAGNATGGLELADKRNTGILEAYAETARVASEWTCGSIELAGHVAEHCLLAEAPISIVFLGYPDGGKNGEATDSLFRLWNGTIPDAETVAHRTTRYDQAGLIAVISEAIHTVQPTTIRTLDIAATHGRDHVDHLVVGSLTLLAVSESGYRGQLLAFRGYNIADEPETLSGALYDRSENMVAHYYSCARHCGTCGTRCPVIDETHAEWLHRRYAIGFRTNVRGVLRHGDRCLTLDPVRMVPVLTTSCADAPVFELSPTGSPLGCVQPDGSITSGGQCRDDAASRFFLDDEGHLWSGGPPPPSSVTAGRHLRCLAPSGDSVAVVPCGDGHAPTWTISEPAQTSVGPAWPPSPGRAVRVLDGQLYTVRNGELVQADGSDLGFSPPVALGAFAVEPESLVVGALGACGRDADGMVCADLPAQPLVPERFSTAFARSGPATPADRSLAEFGSEICGLTDDGVICAKRGSGFVADVRSRWPRPDATLWVGDVDGDHAPDWCAATPDGVSCGRDADRAITADGVPWSFALASAVDPAPGSTSIGALHDVDGDGRDDLCTASGREILCAHSQGYGFGPRVSIGTLPPGGTPTGLWFHLGRACVDDGTTVACVRLPR